jgi:hypothetical protein
MPRATSNQPQPWNVQGSRLGKPEPSSYLLCECCGILVSGDLGSVDVFGATGRSIVAREERYLGPADIDQSIECPNSTRNDHSAIHLYQALSSLSTDPYTLATFSSTGF